MVFQGQSSGEVTSAGKISWKSVENQFIVIIFQLTQIGQNWPKLAKIDTNWPKLIQIGQNWYKLAKIDTNWVKIVYLNFQQFYLYDSWFDLITGLTLKNNPNLTFNMLNSMVYIVYLNFQQFYLYDSWFIQLHCWFDLITGLTLKKVHTFRKLSRKSVICFLTYITKIFAGLTASFETEPLIYVLLQDYTLENCITRIFHVILFLLPKFIALNSKYLGREVT